MGIVRRVKVEGFCNAAIGLRARIANDTSLVYSDRFPDITILLDERDIECPHIDGIDHDVERRAINHIAHLSPSGKVLVLRGAGDIHTDDALHIAIPFGDEAETLAVEQGVYRALLDSVAPKRRWWDR